MEALVVVRTAGAITYGYSELSAWTPYGHARGPERLRGHRGESDHVVRHMNLDPGSLGADDQLQNLRAVREGTRVFSAYELRDGTRIWIITEADRSARRSCCPRSIETWRCL